MHYNRFSVVQRRLANSLLRVGEDPIFVDRIIFSTTNPNEAQEQQPPDNAEVGRQAEQQFDRFVPGRVPGTDFRIIERADARADFTAWKEDNADWEDYFNLRYLVAHHIDLDYLLEIENLDEFNVVLDDAHNEARRAFVVRQLNRVAHNPDRPIDDNPRDPSHFWLKCVKVEEAGRARNEFYVSQTDPQLNMSPVRLGMLNANGSALFLERLPVRRYSQGLTSENLKVTDLLRGPERGGRFPLKSNPALVKTIKGEYPEFPEAVRKIAGGDARSVAFGRNLAVELDDRLGLAFLWYKKQKIGYTDDAERFKIGPNFRFLREELEHNGVNINANAA